MMMCCIHILEAPRNALHIETIQMISVIASANSHSQMRLPTVIIWNRFPLSNVYHM